MDDKILTIGELSVYLKIAKSTIYHLCQKSEMPYSKIGKQLRFRKSSIDNWMIAKEVRRPKAENKETKHILLIDDDQLVLKTIANFLRAHGYNVEPVDNAEDALNKIKQSNFSLVITDIRMPGLNGIETIKKIREFNHAQNRVSPREIIMTGYADSQIEKEAIDLGIKDFIYKPFVTTEFIKTIENRLEPIIELS